MPSSAVTVPSNDALRALRRLAFASLSTVGTYRIPTLHHDIRRCVHLAKRVLETNQTIRSVSTATTTSPSQAVPALEPAERGDDFSIESTRRRRNQHSRRHYTSLEAAHRLEQELLLHKRGESSSAPDWTSPASGWWHSPAPTRWDSKTGAARKPAKPETTRIFEDPALAHAARANVVMCDVVEPPPSPPRRTHSDAAQRIILATQQQHKVHMHRVYGRSSPSKVPANTGLVDCVDAWLKPPRSNDVAGEGKGNVLSAHAGDHGIAESLPDRGKGAEIAVREEPGLRKTIANHKPVLPDPQISTAIARPSSPTQEKHAVFGILGTEFKEWPAAGSAAPEVESSGSLASPGSRPRNSQNKRVLSDPKVSAAIPALGRSSSVPATIVPPTPTTPSSCTKGKKAALESLGTEFKESPATGPHAFISENKATLGVQATDLNERLAISPDAAKIKKAAFVNLESTLEEGPVLGPSETTDHALAQDELRQTIIIRGTRKALPMWEAMMTNYANSLQWEVVDQVYEQYRGVFRVYDIPHAVIRLVRHLFSQNPASARAAALLFPSPQSRRWASASAARDHDFNAATAYLEEVWSTTRSGDIIVSEFHNVLRAAKVQNRWVNEAFFVPVLRNLCSIGQISRAQSLFHYMCKQYQIEGSFHTRAFLVGAYATVDDWSSVEKEIDQLHIDGFSRKCSVQFAAMFNKIFRLYAEKNYVMQTHDFLSNALAYWGLIPSSEISATAMEVYIKHRRFDLLEEWLEAMRVLFPFVDIASRKFVYQLGDSWNKINATCEEVEKTLNVMAKGGKINIRHHEVKAMAREAVARDVARRMYKAQPVEDGKEAAQIDEKSVAEQILAHTASYTQLSDLFGISSRDEIALVRTVTGGGESIPRPLKIHEKKHSFPESLTRTILPSRLEIDAALDSYYAARLEETTKLEAGDHVLLQRLCSNLAQHNRLVEALDLVETIYNGPYVRAPRGAMFDLELMTAWLQMAYEYNTIRDVRAVLWAMHDNGGEMEVTDQFLLLVRMAVLKVLSCDGKERQDPGAKFRRAELHWLERNIRLKANARRIANAGE